MTIRTTIPTATAILLLPATLLRRARATTIAEVIVPERTAPDGDGALITPRVLSLLLAWFSPAVPIGGFSYSHGLSAMFEAGQLADRAATHAAIEAALVLGAGRTDAILARHAHCAVVQANPAALARVGALALALGPSRERRDETVRQGNAFAELVDRVWPGVVPVGDEERALPVAVGMAGALNGVPVNALLHASVTAFAANLVSAAVRLVPLGQTDGQRITAAMAPVVAAVVDEAMRAGLDDVGGAAIGLDIASMRHETQEVRLFRS